LFLILNPGGAPEQGGKNEKEDRLAAFGEGLHRYPLDFVVKASGLYRKKPGYFVGDCHRSDGVNN